MSNLTVSSVGPRRGSAGTLGRWIGLLGALGLMAGCGDNSMTSQDYAERTYAEYEKGAAGQIHFEVKTQQSGSLAEFSDRSLQQILTVPDTWIVTRQLGPELKEVRRVPRDMMQDEWSQPLPMRRGGLLRGRGFL